MPVTLLGRAVRVRSANRIFEANKIHDRRSPARSGVRPRTLMVSDETSQLAHYRRVGSATRQANHTLWRSSRELIVKAIETIIRRTARRSLGTPTPLRRQSRSGTASQPVLRCVGRRWRVDVWPRRMPELGLPWLCTLPPSRAPPQRRRAAPLRGQEASKTGPAAPPGETSSRLGAKFCLSTI
jgi:hypothetical protein